MIILILPIRNGRGVKEWKRGKGVEEGQRSGRGVKEWKRGRRMKKGKGMERMKNCSKFGKKEMFLSYKKPFSLF